MKDFYDKYESPFSTRYASDEMQYLFSQNMKFRTFRKLWIALARAEKKAGLDITDEQSSRRTVTTSTMTLPRRTRRSSATTLWRTSTRTATSARRRSR